MKLPLARTGLPTPGVDHRERGLAIRRPRRGQHYHGGRGAWSGAALVAMHPNPRIVTRSLSAGDLALVCNWIE
jgi:hypothetical protein